MTAALTAVVLLAGAGTIAADYAGRWKIVYALKPTALAAVLLMAVLRPAAVPPRYRGFIVAGLCLSMAGDAFLMLRHKRFNEGLACFLLAHLLYIGAFVTVTPLRADFATVLPLFIIALAMMTFLFPRLGRMKVPVTAYILVIVVMAGLAMERYIGSGGASAFHSFLGAMLFLISDSILAVNRFIREFRAAQGLILSTYFAAQWLLALSIG
jgi:uncharacterized membrane protein YhhN